MESLLERVCKYCPEAVIVSERNGIIRFWNPAAEKLFGWTSSEAIGKYVYNLITPEKERGRYNDDFDEWLQSLVGKRITVPVVNKDGKEFQADFYLMLDSNDKLHYAYFSKDGLYQSTSNPLSNSLYKSLIEQSKYLVWAKDSQTRYTEVNVAAERAFGIRRQDILGKTDSEVFKPPFSVDFLQNDTKALETGDVVVSEDRITLETGTLILSVTRVPMKDGEDKSVGIWGIAHDMTQTHNAIDKMKNLEIERLQTNEQLAIQSSKLKSEFLANMSHEIRTPINGIVGLNNLLKDTELTEEQKDYVEGIHRSCGALMSIINDILDISKVEAGRIQLEILDLDINLLIKDLYAVFLPMAKTKKLEFIVDNRIPKEHIMVKGDYGRIRQILTNILGNAFKFTFSGKIILGADFVATAEPPRIRFVVSDTGIGVAEEKMSTLFRPFTQAEASTTRRFGGTGLGLSISKSLLTLMNGDISVDSVVNKGSTFLIELPYVEGSEQKHVPEEPAPVAGPFRSLSILIAEDNPMNQKVAMKTLEKLGHKPAAADNGLEAVQLLQMNPSRFDMILMDCAMPIMDGYEATMEIRKLPSPVKDIPIIAMTANALAGEKEHCLEVGMNDYMSKPVNRSILERKIEKWASVSNERKKSI